MYKVSLNHAQLSSVYGDFRALELLKENGFDGVDFSLENALNTGLLNASEKEIKNYFSSLKEKAQELGLTVFNAYLPMPCADEMARENAVKAAAWLGAEYLTLCPIVLEKAENNYKKNKALNTAYYLALKPVMEEYGVKVAVENRSLKSNDVWRFFAGKPSAVSSAEKLLDLLEELGDGFYASLDVGHAYLAGEDPAETATLLGNKLALVRLWDTDIAKERRVPPSFGYINFSALMQALKEMYYQGALNFDVDILRAGEDGVQPFVAYLSALGKVLAK